MLFRTSCNAKCDHSANLFVCCHQRHLNVGCLYDPQKKWDCNLPHKWNLSAARVDAAQRGGALNAEDGMGSAVILFPFDPRCARCQNLQARIEVFSFSGQRTRLENGAPSYRVGL